MPIDCNGIRFKQEKCIVKPAVEHAPQVFSGHRLEDEAPDAAAEGVNEHRARVDSMRTAKVDSTAVKCTGTAAAIEQSPLLTFPLRDGLG
ncbi:unnamed protein product [Cylicostephanus goldi]|uniref:Uncharacterized protein n=1 Tax=Cylicostephanus goldi TaxID=71465 RepID=A0A3P7QD19_CYLGO|nr:unnamed protein product [Cylicostephanus goldi]